MKKAVLLKKVSGMFTDGDVGVEYEDGTESIETVDFLKWIKTTDKRCKSKSAAKAALIKKLRSRFGKDVEFAWDFEDSLDYLAEVKTMTDEQRKEEYIEKMQECFLECEKNCEETTEIFLESIIDLLEELKAVTQKERETLKLRMQCEKRIQNSLEELQIMEEREKLRETWLYR